MKERPIQVYMRAANGGRRRSFVIDGVTVYVEPHEDDARAKSVAEFLASAHEVTDSLRDEVAKLRAAVPPRMPARLFGPGAVRFRDGKLWLLNKPEKGWGSFGICLDGWDSLFRQFNCRVTGHGRDEDGEFWTVES